MTRFKLQTNKNRVGAFGLALALVSLPLASGCKDGDKDGDEGDKAAADGAAADGGAAAADSGGDGAKSPTAAAGFDGKTLIPDAAEFIVGVSPKAVASSPLYKQIAPKLEAESDYQEAMAMAKGCNLDPMGFDSVVVGASQSEDAVIIVTGGGIGDDANATCMATEMMKADGDAEAKAEITEADGAKYIQIKDGRVYLVGSDTVAIVTAGWQDTVAGLVGGKGTSAASGSKKDILAKADTAAAVWFAAGIPAELAGMAAGMGGIPQAAEAKTAVGKLDLSAGLALSLTIGFSAEDQAKAAADTLSGLLAGVKGEAPPELSGAIDSIKIEAAGSDLNVSAAMTTEQLAAAEKMVPM